MLSENVGCGELPVRTEEPLFDSKPQLEEEKGFKCSECAAKFRRKDNLARHVRNSHGSAPAPAPAPTPGSAVAPTPTPAPTPAPAPTPGSAPAPAPGSARDPNCVRQTVIRPTYQYEYPHKKIRSDLYWMILCDREPAAASTAASAAASADCD